MPVVKALVVCTFIMEHKDFIMQNHRVHSTSIMPGATFLDIVYRILRAKEIICETATLQNILFTEPIVTDETQNRRVRVTIAGEQNGIHLVSAESQIILNGETLPEWHRNFTGELVLHDAPVSAALSIDPEALKGAADFQQDMETLYEKARGEQIRHGSPMKCFGRLYKGKGYLLAELALDEASAHLEEQFYLHPAKLDASTIVAFGQIDTLGESFIPVFIEEFYAPRPHQGKCYIYVPQQEVLTDSHDIMRNSYLMYDAQGDFVARFKNLTCKRIRFPELITGKLAKSDANHPIPSTPSQPQQNTAASTSSEKDHLPGKKPSLNTLEKTASLAKYLQILIGNILEVQPEQVSSKAGFYDLGLNSTAMLDIARQLEDIIGATLYPTLLFEYSTIENLVDYLSQNYVLDNQSYIKEAPIEDLSFDQSTWSDELGPIRYQTNWIPLDTDQNGADLNDLGNFIVFHANRFSKDESFLLRFNDQLSSVSNTLAHVQHSDKFQKISQDFYLLDAKISEQTASLLDQFSEEDLQNTSFIVFASPESPPGSYLTDDFYAIWALATELIRRKPQRPLNIYFLYEDSKSTISPQHAAIGALAKTISNETPIISCKSIRVDVTLPAESVARILIHEASLSHNAAIPLNSQEICYINNIRYIKQLSEIKESEARHYVPRKNGVYVLAGLGGIGELIAEELAEKYQACIALLGRRPITPQWQMQIDKWNSIGAKVIHIQADITNAADVNFAFEQIHARFGNINGIFHCAGAIKDAVFFRKEYTEMESVINPKVIGTVNLDWASQDDELDFFVLFSSISSILATPGQCDYAYANAFLNQFAQQRALIAAKSNKIICVAWPYWREGGMRISSKDLQQAQATTGLYPMPSKEGLSLLWQSIASSEANPIVFYGERKKIEHMLIKSQLLSDETAAALTIADPQKPSINQVNPPYISRRPQQAAAADSGSLNDDIAIIGLAGQYPQAKTLDDLWQVLSAGIDCISEIPSTRWDHDQYFDPEKGQEGKTYSKWGGFLDNYDCFDAAFFGISRREAERMDPQERLFLQICWKTLEDAGYEPTSLSDEIIGVFAGVMWNHYQLVGGENEIAPNAMHSSVANRVSYVLDLHGPSLSIDTACSSSLVAIHSAAESIRRGECTLALAGGVNVMTHPQKYLQLAYNQFLSTDGRCRSFGKDGSGYVPGEGVGALLLKPLSAAQQDGDHIYAIIKGSSLNHNGKTSGFTVPDPSAQAKLISRALQKSNITPETIDYIETHGTGTSLGDPIEVEGLRKVFHEVDLPKDYKCPIGSIKSNIGHLESAAGIAGVTKVLLQMKHKQLVPSLHAKTPNPHIDFDNLPFYVQKDLTPWQLPPHKGSYYAGISAFGAGGTNAHVVLESYDLKHRQTTVKPTQGNAPYLFVLSAKNTDRLQAYAQSFLAFFETTNEVTLGSKGTPNAPLLRNYIISEVAQMLDIAPDLLNLDETFADLGVNHYGLMQLHQTILKKNLSNREDFHLSLDTSVNAYISYYEKSSANCSGAVDAESLCYTMQVGRTALPTRLAIVFNEFATLKQELERYVQGHSPSQNGIWFQQSSDDLPSLSEEQYVDLFHKNKLYELGRHWVNGAEVPWQLCYLQQKGEAHLPRRISLPTYPFQEERYWLGQWKKYKGLSVSTERHGRPTESYDNKPSPVPVSNQEAQPVLPYSGEEVELRVLEPGIALVILRDQAHHNMFTDGVLHGLQAVFSQIAHNPEIKAVVLTGTDDVFCMGGSPQALEDLANKKGSFTDVPFVYEGLLKCDRPVIAAIQGDAFGGGLAFGLYADIVVMSRESTYSANFLKYGFTPGMGATFILEHRFGSSLALEMLFTGKPYKGSELERRHVQIAFQSQPNVLTTAVDFARHICDLPATGIKTLKSELAGDILKKLPAYIEREVNMHERVLGSESLERIRSHFSKINSVEPVQKTASATDTISSQKDEQLTKPVSLKLDAEQPLKDSNKVSLKSVSKFVPAKSSDKRPESSSLPTNGLQSEALKSDEVLDFIKTILCNLLYMEPHEINDMLSFSEMGIDSIGAVEIVRTLNEKFNLNLDSVAVYDHPTITELVALVLQMHSQALSLHKSAIELTTKPKIDSPQTIKNEDEQTLFESEEKSHARQNEEQSPLPKKDRVNLRALPKSRHVPDTVPPKQQKIDLAATTKPSEINGTTSHVTVPREEKNRKPGASATFSTQQGHTLDTNLQDVERCDRIAVIGMSGRFPDAPDMPTFWENLKNGRCSIGEAPADRWTVSQFFDPDKNAPNKSHSKWAALLHDVDKFDPAFFHLSPLDAEAMDPQQRIFLEEAWKGLENAGYATNANEKRPWGVFVGCGAGDYPQLLANEGYPDTGQTFLGNSSSILAARIAYFLNLSGPTMAIDTACSSSLVAVHLACESVRRGECEMAIAGGVALMLTPQLQIRSSKVGMLSPTGQSLPFDAFSDGIVLGEGAGVVVLKCLNKALADGDYIYGVIRASGINGDGKTNGITAPSAASQAALLEAVYVRAGISPDEISYIEAHGTGTSLGDPIEVKALKQVFQKGTHRKSYCGIGSVKANIGHTTMAAGVAGLLKVLLSLQHRQLPPLTGFTKLNPKIDLDDSPFYIVDQLQEWRLAAPNSTRIATVSSFGFSGTNCHLVVEEFPQKRSYGEPQPQDASALIPLSGRTEEALYKRAEALADMLSPEKKLQDIAFTLSVGRQHLAVRAAFIVNNTQELYQSLKAFARSEKSGQCFSLLASQVDAFEPLSSQAEIQQLMQHVEKSPGSVPLDLLTQLAKAYAAGHEIDWATLYSAQSCQRIPLPTYPFARDRHWVEPAQRPPAAQINPEDRPSRPVSLLDISSFDDEVSETTFTMQLSSENWFVADHHVHDRPLLPGVVSIDMAVDAAKQFGFGFPIQLTSIRWLKPFSVASPCHAYFVTKQQDQRLSFELRDKDAQIYASGNLISLSSGTSPANKIPSAGVDPVSIKKRCSSAMAKEKIYANFMKAGLHYGPSFQVLSEVYFNQTEVLGRLDLSAAQAALKGNFAYHPSLLDGAMQTAAVLFSDVTNDILVPFAIDSLTIWQPLSVPAFSYVTKESDSQFSLHIIDEEGQVCVQGNGVSLRSLQNKSNSAALEAMVFTPTWREALKNRPVPLYSGTQKHIAILYTASALELAEAVGAEHASDNVVSILVDNQTRDFSALQAPYDTVYFLAGPGHLNLYDVKHNIHILFRLTKALLATEQVHHALDFKIISDKSVATYPEQTIYPQNASLHGLARTIAAEYSRWSVKCIDIDLEGAKAVEIAGDIVREATEDQLVALRNGRCFTRAFNTLPPGQSTKPVPYRHQGVYLIVGGVGGIGYALSCYLAAHYQAQLIWVGRRANPIGLSQKIGEIESLGGKALYIQADVSDLDGMKQVVNQAHHQFGSIQGAFHAALVLEDKILANLDEASLDNVLAPKTTGSIVFHTVLQHEPLDFMMFFSSAASFVNNPGQGNYAAASTFEDAYVYHLRRVSSFPVSVVNWGYWGSVGIVASEDYRNRLAQIGIGSIEPGEGIEAINYILAENIPQALVVKANASGLAQFGISLTPDNAIVEANKSFNTLEQYSQGLLRETLFSANILAYTGTPLSIKNHMAQLGIVEAQTRLFLAILRILQRQHVVDLNQDHMMVQEKSPHMPGQSLESMESALVKNNMAAHVSLLRRCVEALPAVLTGQKTPTEVLFPHGSLSLVEAVYQGQTVTDFYNTLLADNMAAFIQNRPQANEPVRILEIGAGTGASSKQVLQQCRALDAPINYVYTDISQAFLHHGEQTFAKEYPFIQFKKLDIETDPQSQGFAPESFDIIFATNVLHATREIKRTLQHVGQLLHPQGVLLINEVTAASDFLTLTFGLTPGWWRFQDAECRLLDAPLLSPQQWRTALEEANFANTKILGFPNTPVEQQEQCLLITTKQSTPTTAVPVDMQIPCKNYIKGIFAEILKHRPENLDDHLTFENFGVDSLISLNIINRFEQDLGPLPATLLFEYLTIEKLAAYFMSEKAGELRATLKPVAHAPAPSSEQISVPAAASIRQVSEQTQPNPGQPAAVPEDIAVIGVSGRYPGSPDIDSFWQNLAKGYSGITEIPANRWDWRQYFDANPGKSQKTYSRWGGFLEDVDQFDPGFFGILPRDAVNMDPQERLFLETAWNLLEEAGYVNKDTREPSTGVFAGMMYGTYGQIAATAWAEGQLAGGNSAYWSVANRVSYFFDFQGPSMAIDTACSSSLTAVYLACESLRRGECKMAIAGGVNLILHPSHFVSLCSLNMLAKDDKVKTFDAQADGFVPGEGVGAVLLKPLQQAIHDGDDIWGIIKTGMINAGGKTAGYTVPNPNAQADLISRAQQRANIDPHTITYLETHGTGTKLGDPIEIAALTKAFKQQDTARFCCALGSVKSNIGHLEGAAGIAGLTKVLLQLKHGKIVPNINLAVINPKIDFNDSPFYVPVVLQDWAPPKLELAPDDVKILPRRAGISSFGAGGANVHLIIEEYLAPNSEEAPNDDQKTGHTTHGLPEKQLFLLSAHTHKQLQAYAEKFVAFLTERLGQNTPLPHMAYTTQVRRQEMAERLAVVASSHEELVQKLKRFLRGENAPQVFVSSSEKENNAAFLFNDEDGAIFMDALMQKQDLEKLASIWVQGNSIQWSKLWPASKPRRVSLPTYPFERKSYWISTQEEKAKPPQNEGLEIENAAHTPPKWQQLYVERSVSDEKAALADHRINGERWVAGAVLLELAVTACTDANLGQSFYLHNVRWPTPLNLETDSPNICIDLARVNDTLNFRVGRFPEDKPIYAQGTIVPADALQVPYWDIGAARQRCSYKLSPATFYDDLKKGGVEYGASFRVVKDLYRGDDEVLSYLELPTSDSASLTGNVLHPVLVDGAMQTISCLCQPTDSYIPVGFTTAAHYRALENRCWAYVRESSSNDQNYRTFDIWLVDEQGHLFATIEELKLAPAPSPALSIETNLQKPQATIISPNCHYLHPVWNDAAHQSTRSIPRSLLLVTSDETLRKNLREQLLQFAVPVIFAIPGSDFIQHNSITYELSIDNPEHCRRLIAKLAQLEMMPDALLHACSDDAFNVTMARNPYQIHAQINTGFYSVFQLITTLYNHNSGAPLHVLYAHQAPGISPQPLYSSITAVFKTLALEHTGFSGVCAQFDAAEEPPTLAARLVDELLFRQQKVAEVRYKQGVRQSKALVEFQPTLSPHAPLPLRADGTYLITGGAGALGLKFAEFFVSQAPLNLILVGRSALDEVRQKQIEALNQSGSSVEYYQADLANYEDVSRLIHNIAQQYSVLNGVIHAAGITRDARAIKKTRAQIEDVFSPKIFGTLYLDDLTKEMPLDFFVLFSSLSAEMGNIGQVDYAYANAFLNDFASLRETWRAHNLRSGKSISIGWPLWQDGGMQVDEATLKLFARNWNMIPMQTQTGIQTFCYALQSPYTSLLTFESPPPQHTKEALVEAEIAAPVETSINLDPRQTNRQTDTLLPQVEQQLRLFAGTFLLVDEQEIDMQANLMELGFDSIALTELINQINEKYQLNLLPTVLFECPTLMDVASYLETNHKESLVHQHHRQVDALLPEQGLPDEEIPVPMYTPVLHSPAHIQKPLIAIIGMAGRLPKSNSVDDFWNHLVNGRDLVDHIPSDRVDLLAHEDMQHIRGGFLEGVDEFDAALFGISPREAILMDPQQRIFLQTIWRLFEDAGYQPSELAGSHMGLFVGVSSFDYGDLLIHHQVPIEAHIATGISHSVLANRISHLFDLHGPSEAVDTACSSALVAIHRAVKAITSGECATAIAGGVNLTLSPGLFIAFHQAGMLSPDGKCKTFDKMANGYVRGEGAGAILLKPLTQALEDGDQIYGVIRGSAVNHCGHSTSLTAPNPLAQAEVIRTAYAEANIDPNTVSYIETHGTGTKLGDPVEIEGLKKAFAQLYKDSKSPIPVKPTIALGSVKTNIGHLESAAGIAGVLKVLLSMKNKRLPANLHFDEVNPYIQLSETPFYINKTTQPWPGLVDENGQFVQRAGVSSFGFGGSNAHVIIDNWPLPERTKTNPLSMPLFPFSAPSFETLKAYVELFRQFLEDNPDINLARIAYTLQVGRKVFPERLVIVASQHTLLCQSLQAAWQNMNSENRLFSMETTDTVGAFPISIAQTWLNDEPVNWTQFWHHDKPLRVSLPGFPFAQTKYWFKRAGISQPLSQPGGTDVQIQRQTQQRNTKVKLVNLGSLRAEQANGFKDTQSDAVGLHAQTKLYVEDDHHTYQSQPTDVSPPSTPDAPGIDKVLRIWLSEILGTPPVELEGARPFAELGLDSIFRMELSRKINTLYNLDLKTAEVYEHDTIEKLVEFVKSSMPEHNQSVPTEEVKAESSDTPSNHEALKADRPDTKEVLQAVISTAIEQPIDPKLSFEENGFTSFDMLRVISVLEKGLGPLRKTLLFDHPTLADLTVYLSSQYDEPALSLVEQLTPPAAEGLHTAQVGNNFGHNIAKKKTGQSHIFTQTETGPYILPKKQLPQWPEIYQQVERLNAQFGKESGLAGRDIASLIFLSTSKQCYFNFSMQGNVLLAWSYVGAEADYMHLVQEWVNYAKENRLVPNLLSLDRLENVAGLEFTATPFGAVQRLEDIDEFTLNGRKMRRLRYLVDRIKKSGSCYTVEYKSGSDQSMDQKISDLVDLWANHKKMVNPYVSTVKEDIRFGRLQEHHRIFLTYFEEALINAIVVTRIPSENGYLLDVEFYPDTMPLGGLDYAIVQIIETLQKEGCKIFSFGASFGVKICESPNAAPEAEQALEELWSAQIFTDGNFQFKNKFRPTNFPIYLCQPASSERTEITDVILMIANPTLTDQEEFQSGALSSTTQQVHADNRRAEPQAKSKSTFYSSQRNKNLSSHGYNPTLMPSRLIEFDLLTDSWAEREDEVILQQISERMKRVPEEQAVNKLQDIPWLPFKFVTTKRSGRAAEALLCQNWPGKRGRVLHNGLFPTWHFNLANNGFKAVNIDPSGHKRHPEDNLFKTNLDISRLEEVFFEEPTPVSFVCIEVSNNAHGGYPLSLSNLRQIKNFTTAQGIPLVLDATRIVENAFFIAAHEPSESGSDIWEIVHKILMLADCVTFSLSKDFGLNYGGLVATNNADIATRIKEHAAMHGEDLNLVDRKMLALALNDKKNIMALVQERMRNVKNLWQKLAAANIPVIGPASGHCILLNVAEMPQFAGFKHPVQACLAWLYKNTGIRGGQHLAQANDLLLQQCIRLAIPIGYASHKVDQVAANLLALFANPSEVTDLLTASPITSQVEAAQAIYYPVNQIPEDIQESLSEGYHPTNENWQVVTEHVPTVERRLLKTDAGDIEFFIHGQGPTLLLMHPFNIGAGIFVDQFKSLAAHYQVVVIHHPGVGETTAASDISLDGITRLYKQVLEEIDVNWPIHVAGASFGSLLAQHFALTYPQYTASLSIICGSYKYANRSGQVNKLEDIIESEFQSMRQHPQSEKFMQEIEQYKLTLLRCESMDPQTGLSYLDLFSEQPDFLSKLPQISTPTLIVHGGCDTVIPVKTVHLLHGMIPNAQLAEIDAAGHFPSITHADEVNQELSQFLAKQSQPQAHQITAGYNNGTHH